MCPLILSGKRCLDCLGGDGVAGGENERNRNDALDMPNTGATNESGFSAVPGGGRDGYEGTYGNIDSCAVFWDSTEIGSPMAFYRYLRWIFQELIASITINKMVFPFAV